MDLIKIYENDNFIVDYNKDRGMYRVSVFEDNRFWDECWFNAYEDEKTDTRDVPTPIKRIDKYWWHGYCPRCNEYIYYNFDNGYEVGHRKHYCLKCGQLCDFENTVYEGEHEDY